MVADGGRPDDVKLTVLVGAVGAAASSRAPLEVTLAALAEDRDDPRLAEMARRMTEELARGVPLEQALAAVEHRLPAEILGLLRAGVACGDLAGTFARYAEQRMATQRFGRRIRAAIAYPLLVAAILVPITLFISLYVLPMFRELFADFELPLPAITQLVLDTGDQMPGIIGGLAAFLLGVPLLMRLLGGRWLYHRVRSATPVVGRLWMWAGQREFAAFLAAFLELRLPLVEAVVHTGEVLSERNMARACRRLVERLESGQSLHGSLAHSIHFDRALVALVAWGEGQNLLPEALRISAEMFEDRVERQATLLQRILPPVALVVVGSAAFCVVVGLMVPMVKLIEGLTR